MGTTFDTKYKRKNVLDKAFVQGWANARGELHTGDTLGEAKFYDNWALCLRYAKPKVMAYWLGWWAALKSKEYDPRPSLAEGYPSEKRPVRVEVLETQDAAISYAQCFSDAKVAITAHERGFLVSSLEDLPIVAPNAPLLYKGVGYKAFISLFSSEEYEKVSFRLAESALAYARGMGKPCLISIHHSRFLVQAEDAILVGQFLFQGHPDDLKPETLKKAKKTKFMKRVFARKGGPKSV
jgi:hypothetical protein